MNTISAAVRRVAPHCCVLIPLLLATPAYSQAGAALWAVSGIQQLGAAASGTVNLSPAGEVFVSGPGQKSFPAPTVTLGDTSQTTNYISKLDSTGRPVYTVAMGGTYQINVGFDSASNVYVSGAATGTGFYTTPGAHRTTGGDRGFFICKLRGSDAAVQYCTYLDVLGGGPSGPVSVDSAGNATLVAVNPDGAPGPGIYVTKLNATGTALIYSTTLASTARSNVNASAVDASGNLFITGSTFSSTFFVTPGAAVSSVQLQPNQSASFVVGLNSTGTALLYSTFGRVDATGVRIALDPAGEAQVMEADASSNLLVRRYSATGAVQFETPLQIPAQILSVPQMAIDSAGVTTLAGSTSSIVFPAVSPTATCAFTTSPTGSAGDYLMRLNPAGAIIQATYLAAAAGLTALNVTPTSGTAIGFAGTNPYTLEAIAIGTQTTPTPVKLSCLGNSASLVSGPLAPGEFVSLFGNSLGPATPVIAQLGPDMKFPTLVANTQVTFNGVPVPLLYVSDTQINAVAPFGLSLTGNAQICASYQGAATNCITASAQEASPAFFLAPVRGRYAAATNQDGTVNSQQNPAPTGSIVSLYVNGGGAVSPMPVDGSLIGLPLPTQNVQLQVGYPDPRFQSLDYLPADVSYIGPAPFEIAGLTQINVRVPLSGGAFHISLRLPDGSFVNTDAAVWTKP